MGGISLHCTALHCTADMLAEMKLAAVLAKGVSKNAAAVRTLIVLCGIHSGFYSISHSDKYAMPCCAVRRCAHIREPARIRVLSHHILVTLTHCAAPLCAALHWGWGGGRCRR
jgi:hypothetical protein